MPRDLPPLAPLVAVEAAARLGSFTRAAEELHLTHGAISRAVQQVEQALGVPLFRRANRRVSLTAEGRLLAECLHRVFADLRQTCEGIRSPHPAPALAVSCEPTLTMRWLLPRLAEFDRRHPALPVRLATAGGPVDLAAEGLDVAIRRSDFGWPASYHVTPLCPEWVGPVCHPQAWDRWGRRLEAAPRLHTRTRPRAWADWLTDSALAPTAGQAAPSPAGEQSFDHFSFSLQAAVAGLGMAMGPLPLVADDLALGVLVAPFGFRRSGADYVALTLSPPQGPLAVLIDWLRAELPAQPPCTKALQ